MKTYRPSVCWQTDKGTEREEREEERERQREACKGRNEVRGKNYSGELRNERRKAKKRGGLKR